MLGSTRPLFSQQTPWAGNFSPFPLVRNILSQGWIMPLPAEVGAQTRVASFTFSGGGFIPQFTYVGPSLTPSRNICGSLTFRRQDMSINVPDTSTIGFRRHETDFVFTGTAADAAVTAQAVVNEQGGFQPTFQNGLTDRTASYLYTPPGDNSTEKTCGSNNLSLSVDQGYLLNNATKWKAKPSEFKRNFQVVNFADAHQSGSNAGKYCVVTPAIQWAIATLPTGAATWYGKPSDTSGSSGREALVAWGSTVRAKLSTTTRKNSPSIIDTKPGYTYGNSPNSWKQIYNESQTAAMLTDEILSYIWLDDCGRFDPNQTALNAVGWRSTFHPTSTSSVNDSYIGTASLISADGRDYRVTVRSGSDPAQGSLSTHVSTVDSPAEFALLKSALGEYMVTKIEVFKNGWEDVTGTVTVGTHPGPGVGLLDIRKSRSGLRFGFRAYPVGVSLFAANRYFMRQVFEHKAGAATEL